MERIKTAVPTDWQDYYNELIALPLEKRKEVNERCLQDSRHHIIINKEEGKRWMILKDQFGREYVFEEGQASGYKLYSYKYRFTREKHKLGYEYLKMETNNE